MQIHINAKNNTYFPFLAIENTKDVSNIQKEDILVISLNKEDYGSITHKYVVQPLMGGYVGKKEKSLESYIKLPRDFSITLIQSSIL